MVDLEADFYFFIYGNTLTIMHEFEFLQACG